MSVHSALLSRRSLQTFRSAGAGRRKADGHYKHSAPLERGRREADSRYYKHSAPLEREGARPTVATTNIPLRWSGEGARPTVTTNIPLRWGGRARATGCVATIRRM